MIKFGKMTFISAVLLASAAPAQAITCQEVYNICLTVAKKYCDDNYSLFNGKCNSVALGKCKSNLAEGKQTGTWPATPEVNKPAVKCTH